MDKEKATNKKKIIHRGSTIKEMLEHSVSEYDALHPDPKGWFLQISGLWLGI